MLRLLLPIALVIGQAAAFAPSSSSSLSLLSSSRSAPAVCALRASGSDASNVLSRRDVLASSAAVIAGLSMPAIVRAEGEAAVEAAPAPAKAASGEKYKLSGDYKTDVSELLNKMKAATEMKKGDPAMKALVEDTRDEMNKFVAYYRRNNKVAGAASFSTLYTAISTLSGHFQNYGPEYPVPEKRKKRLSQQYAEVEKQIARGR
ncbi:hypothetical protein GUITHDRAFT_175477 [Guillardia theta CCMP2712]|uniref:Photosystem II 11 kDa protein n=1 Tax=Guillardia theta (strain CCMP2712) TaxID=905079 RepID=L1JUL8_GUITC|nr:hypothetical protein GUITHDRAFT_175477 [Guillardia theta CCMP2712]EKX52014.1 hypothetical protein GUITHDRAFT_175477 [Guillardia theta CCMP2712]|eukprot:XP_005838994.1 hypothetical protein GUITHDRAFT_175477 [Guillardia theta CCMP2712]